MLSAALMFVSLLIGYVVVVGLVGVTTYGIASMKPSFTVRDFRLSPTFNFLQDLLWLIYSALGGYIVSVGALEASPALATAALALLLLFVVWHNLDEARQRGLIHMMITSLSIIAGVAAGYFLNSGEIAGTGPLQ